MSKLLSSLCYSAVSEMLHPTDLVYGGQMWEPEAQDLTDEEEEGEEEGRVPARSITDWRSQTHASPACPSVGKRGGL